jgi:hypothetical protein
MAAKSRTETDWMVKRAAELPSPGQYNEPSLPCTNSGLGRFSEARPKSDVDLSIQRAMECRSGHVLLPTTLGKRGGAIDKAKKPPSQRDIIEKRSSMVPGPGQYETATETVCVGGTISNARPKSDVDWAILNSDGPGI